MTKAPFLPSFGKMPYPIEARNAVGCTSRQHPGRVADLGAPDGAADAGRDPRRRGPRPCGPPRGRFTHEFGAKWPKAVAKIVDDLDALLAFYDFPAEHWIHLETTNPIETTFSTVRLRTRVTKGAGSRAAGLAMAFKLVESAQHRWRAVNGPHHFVHAGTILEKGVLTERPNQQDQEAAA